MDKFSDDAIIRSWMMNAKPWVKAIQQNEIESRILVTNKAIIEAILSYHSKTVLDVGCGEGWLLRVLETKKIHAFGIDVVPELVEAAQKNSSGKFAICAYENLASYPFPYLFDCMVCNFSLIGKKATEQVIQQAKKLLTERGKLIIQTLHPVIANGDLEYKDGWRKGSWVGFSQDFTDPAPWYFRTMDSWLLLLKRAGFEIEKIVEPLHPKTNRPASIIFVAKLVS